MAIVDKMFERMLEEAGPGEWARYDVLSSVLTPELFHPVTHVHPKVMVERHGRFETLPPEEKPPQYRFRNEDWPEKWTVVRYVSLRREYLVDLADFLGLRREWCPWVPVTELYDNAFTWGNDFDAARPVSVKVFRGTAGALLRLRDDGKRFGLRDLLARKARKERYAGRGGLGFRNLDADRRYELAFEGDGSVANMRVIRAMNPAAEPPSPG